MKSPRKSKQQIEPWDCEGLRISVRGTTFHATGTVRVGKRSMRLRQTLGVGANKENRGEAEREARKIVGRIRSQLGGGVVRRAVATLVAERLLSHTGPSDKRILEDFTAKFTTRILWDVPPEEIIAFVEKRQRGNKAETRERYISGLGAFLNLQITAGQYAKLPEFKRDQKARNPTTRAKRDVQQFRTDLLEDLISAAHITICIQLHVEFVGGTRVSSVLQRVTLGHLDMARMVLVFPKTKNGSDVPVALPETIRKPMEDYLAWRMEQVRRGKIGHGSDQPLFLTYKGVPYKPNGGAWGTQNKTGFNAAKRRAIVIVGKRYDDAIAAMTATGDSAEVERLLRLKADDLAMLKRITQHWLRHKFATDVGRRDLFAAKKQGGWKDTRSILGYLIDDAEYQRKIVEERGSPGADRKASDA